MVYIENGTYTAIRRRAFHHCMRSPPEAMPLPNWGVLSAAHIISITIFWAVARCRLVDTYSTNRVEECGDPIFHNKGEGSILPTNIGKLPTRRHNPQILKGV